MEASTPRRSTSWEKITKCGDGLMSFMRIATHTGMLSIGVVPPASSIVTSNWNGLALDQSRRDRRRLTQRFRFVSEPSSMQNAEKRSEWPEPHSCAPQQNIYTSNPIIHRIWQG